MASSHLTIVVLAGHSNATEYDFSWFSCLIVPPKCCSFAHMDISFDAPTIEAKKIHGRLALAVGQDIFSKVVCNECY